MVMTRYGGLSKTHWQKYRRGYALETKLGGNSMEREANWNVRDPLGLRFDPSCVLYLPLWKKDASSFMSSDAYGHLCTKVNALWTPQGYSFDGDDYISIPDSASLTFTDGAGTDKPFTLIRWINLTNYTAVRAFIGKRDSSTVLEWVFNVQTNGTVMIRFYSASGVTAYIGQQSSSAINTAVWLCLGVTYSGSNTSAGCILYQNGAVFASAASETGVYAGMNNTVATVNLGATNAGTANFFIGTDGEAYIYNRALSLAEIQQIYLRTKWRFV